MQTNQALPTSKINQLGLTTRLLLCLTVAILLVTASVFINNSRLTTKHLLADADSYAAAMLHAKHNQIIQTMQAITASTNTIGNSYAQGILSHQNMLALLPTLIRQHPQIYGSTLALANSPLPYPSPLGRGDTNTSHSPSSAKDAETSLLAPYFYRKDGTVAQTSLDTTAYNYRQQSWFTAAAIALTAQWSEPYYDDGGGNILMTTYSLPLLRDDQFIGVLTADVDLAWLSQLLAQPNTKVSGYAYLISKHGKVLAHPMQQLLSQTVTNASVTSTKKYLQQLVQQGQGHAITIINDPVLKGNGRLYTNTLSEPGWTIGLVLSEQELTAPATQQFRHFWLTSLLGLLLLLVLTYYIVQRLLRPLRTLATAAIHLGHGDFDYALPATITHDEVGLLIKAFARMQHDIKIYIHDKTEIELRQQAIQHEIEIANDIQLSMVPQKFASLPNTANHDDHKKVLIAAKLVPARGIGGDFYDAFWLDDERLFFCLGDVSGKGIPAALFMAKTVTLLRALASTCDDPVGILEQANHELCSNNKRFMFVTMLAGVIHRVTGEVTLVNAGHLPPVLWNLNVATKQVELDFKAIPAATPLGIRKDCQLQAIKFILGDGAGLVLYSDGVTEAISEELLQYGEERLLTQLQQAVTAGDDINTLAQRTVNAVHEFAGSKPAHDDISVLVLGRG